MRLAVKKGQHELRILTLEPPASIGRDAGCDVVIKGRSASRRHARIVAEGQELFVEDLGSTNGTWLNGRRIEGRQRFSAGNVIAIGEYNILLLTEDPETAAPAVEDVPTGELRTIAIEPDAVLAAPRDLRRAYDRLAALYRLARRAGAARSIPELFKIAAEAAAGVLETDRVFPVLREREAWRPLAAGGAKRGALARSLEDLPISRGILDAAGSLQPVIMARRRGERFRERASIMEIGISTALAVPVAVGRELLAVVYADRIGDAAEFAEDDLKWLVAASGILAGALFALKNQERLSARADALQQMLAGDITMIGASAGIERVRRLISAAAPTDAPVLITGESGTGKELVARLVHLESPRSAGPFVVLNCAALPESLAESELFGHTKGAFTGAIEDRPGRFETAQGGAIFLDEVAELPLGLQVKLLRVLEVGEFQRVGDVAVRRTDARVICATNRDVEAMVKAGAFRQDLYYRLNVLRITVPPLRERRDDIRLLLEHYLGFYAERMGRPLPELASEALEDLLAHPWHGNVRELRNAVERLMVLVPSRRLTRDDVHLVLA